MFKKCAILLMVVLAISCARKASDEISGQGAGGTNDNDTSVTQSFSVLWQNYASDTGNSNVVNNQLPESGSISSTTVENAGFNVYSSPVIFKNDTDGTQSVVVLWAKSDQLKISRYTIGTNGLVADTAFSEIISLQPNAATNAFQAHQMSLIIENGVPFILVGHNGGISKYNAITGGLVKEVQSYGSVYRILVDGDSVFIQTANSVRELSAADLSSSKPDKSLTSNTPTRQLPLVISGDHLYVVHGNDVIKLLKSNVSTQISSETIGGGSVSTIAAYNDSVIYSVITFADLKLVSSSSDERTFSNAEFKIFGGNFTTDYNDYPVERNFNSNSVIGDSSFGPIVIADSALYLPGYALEYYTNQNDGLQSGVVAINTSTKAIESAYGINQQDVYATIAHPVFSSTQLSTNYVSRFLILDSNSGQLFSVMNVQETFFQTNDSWGGSFTQAGDTKISAESTASLHFGQLINQTDKARLDNYNTRIKFGNSSTNNDSVFSDASVAVLSVSVGQSAVILAGSDNKLYLFQ